MDKEDISTWRRLWRTLILIDSWVSFTTGTPPNETGATNLNVATQDNILLEDTIQAHMCFVSNVSCQAHYEILSAGEDKAEVTANHLRRLEMWHNNLPEHINLQSLLAQEPLQMSTFLQGSVLLLHLMHLGGLLLIQLPLVLNVARDAPRYASEKRWLGAVARHQYSDCFEAAQSAARVIALIYREGSLFKRCWIILYISSCVGRTLLYKAWLDFINHSWKDFENSLPRVLDCMDMLKWSSNLDHTASGYLATLHLEVNRLKGAVLEAFSESPELQDTKIQISPILDRIESDNEALEEDSNIVGEPASFKSRLILLLENICTPVGSSR